MAIRAIIVYASTRLVIIRFFLFPAKLVVLCVRSKLSCSVFSFFNHLKTINTLLALLFLPYFLCFSVVSPIRLCSFSVRKFIFASFSKILRKKAESQRRKIGGRTEGSPRKGLVAHKGKGGGEFPAVSTVFHSTKSCDLPSSGSVGSLRRSGNKQYEDFLLRFGEFLIQNRDEVVTFDLNQ